MRDDMRAMALLRRVLATDAVTSAAAGLLILSAAGTLSGPLGLPEALLRGAGLVLLPFAAGVAWLAARPSLPRAGVWAVIVANALWAVDSVLLLAGGWVAPTGLGLRARAGARRRRVRGASMAGPAPDDGDGRRGDGRRLSSLTSVRRGEPPIG